MYAVAGATPAILATARTVKPSKPSVFNNSTAAVVNFATVSACCGVSRRRVGSCDTWPNTGLDM
ncbi:hypothetical protein GORHZ_186_00570 [Gordonia rhizosphera NBRC 16068]|uniref:Uncharacterized protein n=1 Tax=Gordonia rhizosphera NBRC 16068 TaxID=1108045 RepID=K6WFZ1_9ACTN|nr:hypothetical protein GORHZ_186_00570 [Gordonia rhizosphera NBRC 16068]